MFNYIQKLQNGKVAVKYFVVSRTEMTLNEIIFRVGKFRYVIFVGNLTEIGQITIEYVTPHYPEKEKTLKAKDELAVNRRISPLGDMLLLSNNEEKL